MPRTIFLLAGLGAALIIGGFAAAVRTEATPSFNQTPWVKQAVQDVTAGQVYRLDGCLTVTGPGLEFVSLRVAWYAEQGGYGSALSQDEFPGNPWLVGSEQCLSLTDADAPCASRSARYGVVIKGDTAAVDVSSLEFSLEPGATPVPCPTPTPTPTPISTPTPMPPPTSISTPTPMPPPTPISTPTPIPPPEPTTEVSPTPSLAPPPPAPAAAAAAEPTVFPSLVNGGFEEVREDGTPYGWRKIGGEMSATSAVRAQGDRSAAFVSRTESTKWLYQTVSVQGGSYYRLQAQALKNDPGVRETLLRVSWYESADGSGIQMDTADSGALAADSPGFVALDTGPMQAPPEARSAKVRLLLRPASAANTVVYFDDVRFQRVAAPPPIQGAAIEDEQPSTSSGTESRHRAQRVDPQPGMPVGEVLSSRSGPTLLANVRQVSERQGLPAAAGSGRPLWPLLLALAVPAAGLTVMAVSARRRAHIAGRNEPHV